MRAVVLTTLVLASTFTPIRIHSNLSWMFALKEAPTEQENEGPR
jgi:hypothetical protein